MTPDTPRSAGARFPTTHWGRVVEAAAGDSPAAREALGELCRAYWYPLYAWIRRRGHGPVDALDLTQAYFARLLGRGALGVADPLRGRFRAFLRADCGFFLADARDRDRALKRGGGRPSVSIDARDAEGRYLVEPAVAETPDRLFDRAWALALLARAFDRLPAGGPDPARAALLDRLKPALAGGSRPAPHAAIAADLGLTEAAVESAARRLRRRFAEAVRSEIAATLDDPTPAEVEAEIRALFDALGR